MAYWERIPPASESLARIAEWLGSWKPTSPATAAPAPATLSAEDFARDFLGAGGVLVPAPTPPPA